MVYVGLDDFSGLTAEMDIEEDISDWLIEVEKEPGGLFHVKHDSPPVVVSSATPARWKCAATARELKFHEPIGSEPPSRDPPAASGK
jgi:hypothetical protein